MILTRQQPISSQALEHNKPWIRKEPRHITLVIQALASDMARQRSHSKRPTNDEPTTNFYFIRLHRHSHVIKQESIY